MLNTSTAKNNRLKHLIRNAELEQPDASMAAIDYTSGRKLNKSLITHLAICEYITEYRNNFITDATDSGKTYISYTLGLEACKQYFIVKYVCLPDLLLVLLDTQSDGSFANVLKKYANLVLLMKLTESEARDLFELVHKKRKRSSTIFYLQYHESE